MPENNQVNRSPRATTTREKSKRPTEWKPPSLLDAPPAPDGYIHRWIRAEMLGQDDKPNMTKRIREGYEPVRGDEYPDFEVATISEGKYKGVIGVGGLILARLPVEVAESRKKYFAHKTNQQMSAVDNDLMREENPTMPLYKERSSRVSFGGSTSRE
ncbi:MAG TPA: hypothetical protein DF712_20355 [Balneola sp.]|nr:hypothetical protein [Balneola sp.]|tara:strand:+ start:26 stop:496 length:471 start_codon:yes stop_codon:yes gene_type:complete